MFWVFRYHPDKNANDANAADMFKEVTFSYNILSDPDKRRQYDTAGFEVRLTGQYSHSDWLWVYSVNCFFFKILCILLGMLFSGG